MGLSGNSCDPWRREARSNVTDKDIKRLEQVDTCLLKSLVKGHSKTPVFFHHLKTGTLMLRHILMINQLIYHITYSVEAKRKLSSRYTVNRDRTP